MSAILKSGVGSLTLIIDAPVEADGITTRDDLIGVKVWLETSGPGFTTSDTNLVSDSNSLSVTLHGLTPRTTYYVKYALISDIEPDNYVVSSALSSQPLELAYSTELTPPPTPTGVTITAGISNILIEHDRATYTVGHGHSRTVLMGAEVVTAGVYTDYSNAKLLAEFTGEAYAYATQPAKTWQLWLVWVTVDGVASTVPYGGNNGVVIKTGEDVSPLLTALSGSISESQLYGDLKDRIDLIDGPETLIGSVGARIQTEATARAEADSAMVSDITTVQARIGRVVNYNIAASGASAPVRRSSILDEAGTAIATATRSYMLTVLNGYTGELVSHTSYDVYAGMGAANMAAALNACAADTVVIVSTEDEPKLNRLSSGLDTAMYRCGASKLVFGSDSLFKYRGAYILVGIPGIGEGAGVERYAGSSDSATDAYCEYQLQLINGRPVALGGNMLSAAVQTEASIRADQTGELYAKYGVKLDVNGYVTGWSMNNDGSTGDMLVLADRFAIGSPGLNSRFPFIVQTTPTTIDGVEVPAGVYMEGAYIKRGTIDGAAIVGGTIEGSKLIDVSADKITTGKLYTGQLISSTNYVPGISGWAINGSGIAEFSAASIRGLLAATQIDTKNLSIRDADNNVIFSAGTNLDWNRISGTSKPADSATSGSNLVKKTSFADGSKGSWSAYSIASNEYTNYRTGNFLIFNVRDSFEAGNKFPVIPGEVLYAGATITTWQSIYTANFGVAFYNASGEIISFTVGAPSPASTGWYRRTGTITVPEGAVLGSPWFQIDGPSGQTYLDVWATEFYLGRQQEGATVGAPTGTYVGSTLSQTVESNASTALSNANTAQSTADSAVSGLAGKLNKAGEDIMSGEVKLTSNYALWFGDSGTAGGSTGVYIGNTGIVGKKDGNTTFALDNAGNATFGGTLSGATGTFSGSLSAATGTFSGSLSAATGTFSGTLSAAGGVFDGDLSAAVVKKLPGRSWSVANGSYTSGYGSLSGLTTEGVFPADAIIGKSYQITSINPTWFHQLAYGVYYDGINSEVYDLLLFQWIESGLAPHSMHPGLYRRKLAFMYVSGNAMFNTLSYTNTAFTNEQLLGGVTVDPSYHSTGKAAIGFYVPGGTIPSFDGASETAFISRPAFGVANATTIQIGWQVCVVPRNTSKLYYNKWAAGTAHTDSELFYKGDIADYAYPNGLPAQVYKASVNRGSIQNTASNGYTGYYDFIGAGTDIFVERYSV